MNGAIHSRISSYWKNYGAAPIFAQLLENMLFLTPSGLEDFVATMYPERAKINGQDPVGHVKTNAWRKQSNGQTGVKGESGVQLAGSASWVGRAGLACLTSYDAAGWLGDWAHGQLASLTNEVNGPAE